VRFPETFTLLRLTRNLFQIDPTGFGIRSVLVVNGKGIQKSSYASSTNRLIKKVIRGLIIPRSWDPVLMGLLFIIKSWRYGIENKGFIVP
jgi:hypothetical protein